MFQRLKKRIQERRMKRALDNMSALASSVSREPQEFRRLLPRQRLVAARLQRLGLR